MGTFAGDIAGGAAQGITSIARDLRLERARGQELAARRALAGEDRQFRLQQLTAAEEERNLSRQIKGVDFEFTNVRLRREQIMERITKLQLLPENRLKKGETPRTKFPDEFILLDAADKRIQELLEERKGLTGREIAPLPPLGPLTLPTKEDEEKRTKKILAEVKGRAKTPIIKLGEQLGARLGAGVSKLLDFTIRTPTQAVKDIFSSLAGDEKLLEETEREERRLKKAGQTVPQELIDQRVRLVNKLRERLNSESFNDFIKEVSTAGLIRQLRENQQKIQTGGISFLALETINRLSTEIDIRERQAGTVKPIIRTQTQEFGLQQGPPSFLKEFFQQPGQTVTPGILTPEQIEKARQGGPGRRIRQINPFQRRPTSQELLQGIQQQRQ